MLSLLQASEVESVATRARAYSPPAGAERAGRRAGAAGAAGAAAAGQGEGSSFVGWGDDDAALNLSPPRSPRGRQRQRDVLRRRHPTPRR